MNSQLQFNFSTKTFEQLIKLYWTLGDPELLRALAEQAKVEFHNEYRKN